MVLKFVKLSERRRFRDRFLVLDFFFEHISCATMEYYIVYGTEFRHLLAGRQNDSLHGRPVELAHAIGTIFDALGDWGLTSST